MRDKETETWERARKARDKLASRLMANPQVGQVAIGYDPNSADPVNAASIVIRIEVKSLEALKTLNLPEEIDGFPVRVEVVGYRPE
jgi:hypothetical protein